MKAEKELADILEHFHKKVNVFRSLEHFLEQEEFTNVFLNAEEIDRTAMRKWILDGNYQSLRDWITSNKGKFLDVEYWTLVMLRQYSRKHHIKNYGILTKGTLIRLVKDDMDKSKFEKITNK